MLKNWITKAEVLARLEVTDRQLDLWRVDASESIRHVLKRPLRSKPTGDGLPSLYWRPDIEAIQGALKPWREFSAGGHTWLPGYLVRSQYADLQRRRGLRDTAKARQFLTEHQRAGLALRWFYRKDCLDAHRQRLEAEPRQLTEWLTKEEAIQEFETSHSALSKLLAAKKLKPRHEDRPVDVVHDGAAIRQLASVALLSRAELAKQLGHRLPEHNKEDRKYLRPSEAEELTKGDFTATGMAYWEDHDCPHLGARLTVVTRDAVVMRETDGAAARVFLPGAKHYLRAEIEQAHRAYKKRAARPRGIITESGGTWYTVRAAMRERLCNQRTLQRWAEAGLIDTLEQDRTDMGYNQRTTYYRADGARGFLQVVKLRGGKRGPMPAELRAASETALTDVPAPSAADDSTAKANRDGRLGEASRPEPYPTAPQNTRETPLYVVTIPDPRRAVGSPGAPVKAVGLREFVDELRATQPDLTWKEIHKACRVANRFDNLHADAEALKQYCRPQRPKKIVG